MHSPISADLQSVLKTELENQPARCFVFSSVLFISMCPMVSATTGGGLYSATLRSKPTDICVYTSVSKPLYHTRQVCGVGWICWVCYIKIALRRWLLECKAWLRWHVKPLGPTHSVGEIYYSVGAWRVWTEGEFHVILITLLFSFISRLVKYYIWVWFVNMV